MHHVKEYEIKNDYIYLQPTLLPHLLESKQVCGSIVSEIMAPQNGSK
jgi:hypothetical protein